MIDHQAHTNYVWAFSKHRPADYTFEKRILEMKDKADETLWKANSGGEIGFLCTAIKMMCSYHTQQHNSDEFTLKWKLPDAKHMTDYALYADWIEWVIYTRTLKLCEGEDEKSSIFCDLDQKLNKSQVIQSHRNLWGLLGISVFTHET